MAKTKAQAAAARPRVALAASAAEAGPNATILWEPNPGPQTEALRRTEREILFGGAKGGGKSAAGIAWLLSGNPDRAGLPDATPTDISYINNPSYRALVLRKNRADMDYWISEARKLYSALGGEWKNGTEFEFPSGAKIIVGHLAEDLAYEKYQGNQVHRILIEEVTQIGSLNLYTRVIDNCRSNHREMRAQVFLTANPGGLGNAWVSKRFMTTRPETYGKTIRQRIKDPVTGTEMAITRCFIPSRVTDNKKFLEIDPTYAARLYADYAHDENMRRALLEGDWTALSGNYFTNWRPNGPMLSEMAEFPWARHVIEPVHLAPSWPKWIGVDWGYKHHSVAVWACQAPNKQVHVYRELLRSQMGPQEFGVDIALASLKDVDGLEDGAMTVWLSPDAFAQRQDDRTVADMMAAGIRTVLGPDSVYIMAPGETDDDTGERDFFDVREMQQKAGIVLRRAQHHRVAGWQYMHSLMRFKPLVRGPEIAFDAEYAMRLASEFGASEYSQYVEKFRQEREALPILQVHTTCPNVIAAIPTAMHWEDKNPDDIRKTDSKEDDILDATRYLLAGHKAQQVKAPLADFVRTRIAEIAESHGGRLGDSERMWASAKAQQDWKGGALAGAFSAPRMARRARYAPGVN